MTKLTRTLAIINFEKLNFYFKFTNLAIREVQEMSTAYTRNQESQKAESLSPT